MLWEEFIKSLASVNYSLIFGSGGVLAGLVFMYNMLAKRRDESTDISKFRMERIKDNYADYMLLVGYSYAIIDSMSTTKSFFKKIDLFVSILKFTQIAHEIEKNGSFLLSHQDAESLLQELVGENIGEIKSIFQDFDYHKFRELDSTKSLHVIREEICKKGTAYNKSFIMFSLWLKNTNANTKNRINTISRCIGELMILELNWTYEKWYNTKFRANTFLSDDSRNYLLRKTIDSRKYRRKLKLNCEL